MRAFVEVKGRAGAANLDHADENRQDDQRQEQPHAAFPGAVVQKRRGEKGGIGRQEHEQREQRRRRRQAERVRLAFGADQGENGLRNIAPRQGVPQTGRQRDELHKRYERNQQEGDAQQDRPFPNRAPGPRSERHRQERKSVVEGKSVSVRGALGGRRNIKKNTKNKKKNT